MQGNVPKCHTFLIDRFDGCRVRNAAEMAELVPVCCCSKQHDLMQLSRLTIAHAGDLLSCADAAADNGLILFGRVIRSGWRFFFSEKLHDWPPVCVAAAIVHGRRGSVKQSPGKAEGQPTRLPFCR